MQGEGREGKGEGVRRTKHAAHPGWKSRGATALRWAVPEGCARALGVAGLIGDMVCQVSHKLLSAALSAELANALCPAVPGRARICRCCSRSAISLPWLGLLVPLWSPQEWAAGAAANQK